jgi:hypothetical protein
MKLNTVAHYSPKMRMWAEEAYREKGSPGYKFDTNFAIFPKRFYEPIASFDHTKRYDFCFIGAFAVDRETYLNRQWLIPFIEKNFGEKSFLHFTDKNAKSNHLKMGNYDHTLDRVGFVPKEVPINERNYFDEGYYKIMSQSCFTLCPGGDSQWSMRFYEALMCGSIPIVLDENFHRSIEETFLAYKYYSKNQNFEYKESWVTHNYDLFLRYHTLLYKG